MTNAELRLEPERATDTGAEAQVGLAFLQVSRLRRCPYLAGQAERLVVAPLTGDDTGAEYGRMLRAGFRRSGTVAYRPACPDCRACVSVRVRVESFAPGRSLRRVAARNRNMKLTTMEAAARAEHFSLFRRYQEARHPGGAMAAMDERDYAALVEDSSVATRIAEFREPDGRLYGVTLFDVVDDGLSAVYSFYDPARSAASPGSYMILGLIAEARARGLPFLYLGYWIEDCEKMDYKARFRPLEALGPGGWTELEARSNGVSRGPVLSTQVEP